MGYTYWGEDLDSELARLQQLRASRPAGKKTRKLAGELAEEFWRSVASLVDAGLLVVEGIDQVEVDVDFAKGRIILRAV